ncbi:MAG: hypothetical protein Q9160_004720 [Pyrenula sp. 1 TL-2023]
MPFRASYASEPEEEGATEFYNNLRMADPAPQSHNHQASATDAGDFIHENNQPRDLSVLLVMEPNPEDLYRNGPDPRRNWSVNDRTDENNPPRHELILLGPGEKKLIEEVDTRVPNACIFTFNKEDHTLGNLLRARLLENPHILFSGYKVPHPLVPSFILRVQTDGEITPKQALIAATTDLVSDLDNLSREFTKEFELVKMAQTTQNGE